MVANDHTDNLLIQGDSYDALHALCRIPEYAQQYRGKVKLVYIDPPFNTGQSFADYSDSLEHSIWLSMIRERFLLFRELLSPDATLWVHLDDTEVHRARCLLDEIFGPSCYLATVVWQRTSAKSLARRTMGTMHESILVYGATEKAELRPLYLPLEEEYLKRYSNTDERGQYDTGDLTAGSHRPHLDSGMPWRGFDPSGIRRCWAVPRNPLVEVGLTDDQIASLTMRDKLEALDDAGYIHWPKKNGGFPRYKKYLHNTKGRSVGNLWTDINVINSQAAERTGFSTQKPEALIERIIAMGSDPGEIVLDCFAGSGTTATVAHKMHRRWVTVEALTETADKFTRPRLERVVAGDDTGGVTKSVEWQGGGGFRSLQIAPSALEVVGERVFLADWLNADDFAEMVAAQLGFTYSEADGSPFYGRRGRARLAVVDGVVDEVVARGVIGQLDEGERAVVVGKGVAPEAEALVRELSPGSKVMKAPRDLIRRGRAVR
ncbi:site-specific DNA-methyltransferase [Streptomyces sp. NPDC126522]|uniref:site-specific DNA-methyltransferase n=1 Tax=Streptomyces sp. NPDC126522 TaxID=3155211 RepID=UPI00332F3F7B